jgi:hypothetical protein
MSGKEWKANRQKVVWLCEDEKKGRAQQRHGHTDRRKRGEGREEGEVWKPSDRWEAKGLYYLLISWQHTVIASKEEPFLGSWDQHIGAWRRCGFGRCAGARRWRL